MGLNWIEIDKSILKDNIRKIKMAYGTVQSVGAMVKANAYGHGVLEVVQSVYEEVESFYVSSADDALLISEYLSENNIKKRVICVGAIDDNEYSVLTKKDIEFAIVDESYKNWKNIINGKIPKIHIFVDTGLGREGIRWDSFDLIDDIIKYGFDIIGLMTHFNNAEHAGPPVYAVQQFERYCNTLNYINKKGVKVESHTAASVPSLLYPEARCNITRLGILMYGYWTSVESKILSQNIYGKNFPDVQPVLSWKAQTRNIKIIPKGDYIGYDCAYLCQKDTKVATINVGYYDGYPCLFDSNAWVLVDGKRCAIVGNVMMNSMVIDISDITMTDDNEITVVLIGKSGEEEITIDDLARWARITNYDVLAAIKEHVIRKVINTKE